MRTKARYVVLALALASVAAAYGALGGARGRSHRTDARSAGSALRATGHVDGLYPGARKGLHVRLRNRSGRWVTVRAIRADVKDGARGCPRDNLWTQTKELANFRVPPRETRRVGIQVRMWPRAPDACQGVRFPLRFVVRAER
jgi:hypothetical protein